MKLNNFLNIKLLIGNLVKGFSWFHCRFTGLRLSDAVRLWRDTKLADFKGKVHRGLNPHYFLLLVLFLGSVQNAMALDGTSFTTKWETTGANEDIIIPVKIPNTYSYDIDCGDDGNFEQLGVFGAGTCNYPTAGEHIIRIRGTFPAIYVNDGAMKAKILSVEQWGNIVWGSMERAFHGASNLQISATDSPNLNNVTNMSGMFYGATAFNQDISNWNVVSVTDMSNMLRNASG